MNSCEAFIDLNAVCVGISQGNLSGPHLFKTTTAFSDSFGVKNGKTIARNRKLKHAGLFLFKVIQIYADPLIEVCRGRTRIRICSLHSKESNVYVWRPAGMSDPLSGECMCLMLESPWDMGTFL